MVDMPKVFHNARMFPAIHVWDDNKVEVLDDVVRDAFGCLSGESDRCEREDYIKYDKCGRLIPPKPDCARDEIYNFLYGSC